MIDHDLIEIVALDDSDARRFSVRVAGPAALIVAKVYKLRDRLAAGKADRIADKDAADVYRLMLTVPMSEFLLRLEPILADETARSVCSEAVDLMVQMFGARLADGVRMAIDALRVAVPEDQVADVCNGFVRHVREGLEHL